MDKVNLPGEKNYQFPVTYRTEKDVFIGMAKNIDKDGITIEGPILLAENTTIELEFQQPRTTAVIKAHGRVKGVNGSPNSMVIKFCWNQLSRENYL